MSKDNTNKKRKKRIFPADSSEEITYPPTTKQHKEKLYNTLNETNLNNLGKNDNRYKDVVNRFKSVIQGTHEKSKAIKWIVNLKKEAVKWKKYVTFRRSTLTKVDNVDGSEAIIMMNKTAGIGLDQIHDDFLEHKDKMSVESNRALINYFADLGRQKDENASINLEFVDALLKSGAQIGCTDKHGQCVLHEVARAWHIDVAKFFVSHGADVNQADNYGRTALHIAAAVNYPEMINFLIQNGANKEVRTKEEDQTAVHYAAKNDACLSLKALVDHGCEYKLIRDYKLRTPIHIAAELDRSETARMLLEFGAPVGVSDDSNQKAITWMIAKMPPVAKEALNEFHSTDRAKRKQYFRLDLLVQQEWQNKYNQEESYAQSPLHVAVNNRQFDLLTHRVFMKLISVNWHRFGRFAAWRGLLTNFCFIMLWTLKATIIEYDKKYIYQFPGHWWRVVLLVVVIAFTVYYICEEILEYVRSVKGHRKWKAWREKEITRDMRFCHPCWPEELSFLEEELQYLDDTKPKYFKDLWNIFDWICYVLVLASITSHFVDIAAHSHITARAHIRIMCFTVILLWMRLMKNARAFELVGPFIVIAGHMLYDIIRFVFLYLEFYIPFVCAFWMIFGGNHHDISSTDETTSKITVPGFLDINEVFFSLFRLTLVDEYDYGAMKSVDSLMSDLLLGFWFAISAILCLNLFIALLSDTFQRVYDNAQANAIMQKTITILSWWDTMSPREKGKFYQYIVLQCAPVMEYYDDDVSGADDYDLQKATIQIRRDLNSFIEKYDSHQELSMTSQLSNTSNVTLSRFENESRVLRESILDLQTRQEKIFENITHEMRAVREVMLEMRDIGRDKSPRAVSSRSDHGLSSHLEEPSTSELLVDYDEGQKSRRRHHKSKNLFGKAHTIGGRLSKDNFDTPALLAHDPQVQVSEMPHIYEPATPEHADLTFPDIRLRTDFDDTTSPLDRHAGPDV